MTETSRLSSTAQALGLALETLADALAHVRPEAIAASETLIESRAVAFLAAAADAVASGDSLAPERLRTITRALSRCRRLGCSLLLMTGQPAAFPDAPRGYTPVGRPVSPADAGTFLTARV